VLAVAILLPVGARAVSSRWHDDSLWANSLRSLGGLEVPFDFAVYLRAADDVRAGESPYVDPEKVSENAPAPYVYPPLLAILLVPATALPDKVGGSSPVGVLVSLLLVACVVGTLVVLDVRDWRCYPVALLYPATLENIEYGAVGPVLALLVALTWRYRDRVVAASAALGGAVVLKVFLWPLFVWLAATRRWTAALGAAALALGLSLSSWAVIGFGGLTDYPELLRRLSDIEAASSYSAFAMLVTLNLPESLARVLVVVAAATLLALAWRFARGSDDAGDGDRRAFVLALAAAFVLTPILWLHYLVLLVVPIALARPRLSALWFVPLALTVFEALDWYRGWPRGDGPALASVAVITAFVFAISASPRDAGERRLAAWL
jgi:alpha-1,2-mannosyltransferase